MKIVEIEDITLETISNSSVYCAACLPGYQEWRSSYWGVRGHLCPAPSRLDTPCPWCVYPSQRWWSAAGNSRNTSNTGTTSETASEGGQVAAEHEMSRGKCLWSCEESLFPYLAVGEDWEADGTLLGQNSLNKLPVVGFLHSLHYVLQRVGGTVLQKQRQRQLTATPAWEVVHCEQPPTYTLLKQNLH